MKLSKDERYTAYCIMLVEAEDILNNGQFYFGLCWLIKTVFGINEFGINDFEWETNTNYFKELKKHEPKNIALTGGWFGYNKTGWEKRVSILKQAINETHP